MSKNMQEERMAEKLAEGNFYEYTQLIKTIFFKYKMRRRFEPMKALIQKAIEDLAKLKQTELLCDIYDLYYIEQVQKMRANSDEIKLVEDVYLYNLSTLMAKNGDQKRVLTILEKVVSLCVSNAFTTYNEKLCSIIADIHKSYRLFSKAYTYNLRAKDLVKAMDCLKEVVKQSYHSEKDLFATRLAFEVLIRWQKDGKGISYCRKMRNDEWLFDETVKNSPLSNFVNIALEAIEIKDFQLYKQLVTHYQPHLKRDSKFYEYLDRIARYYFDGQTIRAPNMMQTMMNSMMQGGMPKMPGMGQ